MTLQELQGQVLQLSIDDRAALAQILLTSLHPKTNPITLKEHPLAKFAGILSDAEAAELQQSMTIFEQVDPHEW